MSIYFAIIIGLIIYNFIKKKNYEAKSHLIFLALLIGLIIIIVVLLFFLLKGINVPIGIL